MNEELKKKIESVYGFKITSITEGPRQFVAETFILETDKEKYFVKVTDKPLFKDETKAALPALRALYETGFTRISYPIKASDETLFFETGDKLVVVYNFIDLPQNYEYKTEELGATLATIHNIKLQDESISPKDNFEMKMLPELKDLMKNSQEYSGSEEILKNLRILLKKYQEDTDQKISQFLELGKILKEENPNLVITHGDAGGNTLYEEGEPIQIIDWDALLLACPERDIWNFYFDEGFMKGYKSVRPEYKMSINALKYYILYYYLTALAAYTKEIVSSKLTSHREHNLEQLNSNLFEGWMKPIVAKMMAL